MSTLLQIIIVVSYFVLFVYILAMFHRMVKAIERIADSMETPGRKYTENLSSGN